MEVASPTPIQSPFTGRSKRSYACAHFAETPVTSSVMSENLVDGNGNESPTFGPVLFKRRRYTSNEEMVGNTSHTTFRNNPSSSTANPKRVRTENGWNPSQAQQQIVNELRRLVEHQASEVERLKSEKHALEGAVTTLKSANEKGANENRILKRAVTIQQERQQQAVNEIEAARAYKVQAEERIRRLEQFNLNLQYRLEALSPKIGNDFMGFNQRPPDVY